MSSLTKALTRTDVRGDWRLSHLEDIHQPLPRPSTLSPITPLSSPFHPGQLVSCGSRLGDSIPALCLLDLLILLHLNLINSSTGPEDEKNGNSLLFFVTSTLVLLSGLILYLHTPTPLCHAYKHTHVRIARVGDLNRMEKKD